MEIFNHFLNNTLMMLNGGLMIFSAYKLYKNQKKFNETMIEVMDLQAKWSGYANQAKLNQYKYLTDLSAEFITQPFSEACNAEIIKEIIKIKEKHE